jgi:hypothetical protein
MEKRGEFDAQSSRWRRDSRDDEREEGRAKGYWCASRDFGTVLLILRTATSIVRET